MRRFKILFGIIVIILVLILGSWAWIRITGSVEQVKEVIDGDTFILKNGEHVRLLAIDAPERDERGYQEATTYLERLVLGKSVLINRRGLDRYQRTLAWVNGGWVNLRLILSGHARPYMTGNPIFYLAWIMAKWYLWIWLLLVAGLWKLGRSRTKTK